MSVGGAISVGSTIYGILSPPIFRQCGYILFCNSNASDLKEEIDKLKDAAARVQHSVDESRSAGEFIYEDVLAWLKKVDEHIESGNRILETNKIGRLIGCVPDPKACHKLGRDAKKAIPNFEELRSKGVLFDKVSYRRVEEQSLIVGAATSSKRKYVELKSRTAVLKFVMEALDDDNIDTIGVYGMGGVGKTTLLKEVEKGAKEMKKFDGVVSVFVSQTPNLMAIHAEIDYRLKRLGHDESRKAVLILFDDLWKPLNLKDTGVPESNNKLRVKLVMTSRNKQLLASEMSCQRTFSVGVLGMDEAWQFFAELVSSKVEDLKGKPAAVAFLKKCAGLPVSIEALATLWKKKMNSSSGDLSEDELKHARESPDVFVSLDLSYNHLGDGDGDEENPTKLVFRTIGLLGTPKVPVLTLIKYIVGLGLFGSSASYNIVERVRMEITRSLRTLQESSLLLESEDNDHIKIHDVVRDVAVRIASRENHALIYNPIKGVKEWSMEKLKDCKSVALTYSALLEVYDRWNSPDLNIFFLEVGDEQGDHPLKLLDAFFKEMVKLRVIHFKNAQITLLPSSINPDLQNLTTLCFDNCCLGNISAIGKLVTLHVLSFTGSNLAKLPEEIGGLTNLRMLDLSKCSMLEFIESGILERLTQLEELYLRESFDRWEIEGDGGKHNASLEELNSMPRLRTLEVHVPDTSKLPQNLPFGNLVQCKVLMGESWDWSGEYEEARTLKLEVKSDRIMAEEWFQSVLQKTQDLHLEGLDRNMESFHELCSEGFKELKHLHLQNSSSVECIIWSLEWLECSAFMALESMIIEKMQSLVKICDGHISPLSFSKLKVLRVQECHKLSSLFNVSLLKNLTELEEIEISDCKMLQQIVIGEHINDDDATSEELQNVGMIGGCSNIFFSHSAKRPTYNAEDTLLLGSLRYLTLRNLPEVKSFFFTTEGGPSDESMGTTLSPVFFNDQKVSQPPKYKEMSVTRLGLDKLQRIELTECKNVVHFINSQELLKLANLESLTIVECECLEDIFDLEGIEPESGNVRILPKLYELKLRKLPKLEHIWKKNPKQQIKGYQKLRTVEIYDCDNLLYFSSSFMCEVMENLTEINIGYCLNMYSVFLEEEGPGSNASSTKTSLTSLKSLAISYCPNLKSFLSCNSKCNNNKMTYWCYGKKVLETSNSFFFNEKVLLPSLESILLYEVKKIEKLWCGEIPDQSYRKLEYLHVKYCNNLLTIIPASLIERLHNLKQLWVMYCLNLEVVFDFDVGWKTTKKSKVLMLPQLHEVKLTKLPNLRHVMERSSDDEIVVGFPSLNRLRVSWCHNLINLISTTTATTLLELKSLDISTCFDMLDVVGGEVSERRCRRNAITLPHLTSLSLTDLMCLTCFSYESYRFDFTRLKILKIVKCSSLKNLIKPRSDGRLGSQDEDVALFNEKIQLPNLEELYISDSFSLEELWCNKPPTTSSFCKLKFLEVSRCSRLQSVIPSFMVNKLQNMERISISNCNSLQDIFKTTSSTKQIQSLHVSGIVQECIVGEIIGKSKPTHEIIFMKLTFLELEGNIKLSNLWSGSYTLKMPSLKKLFLNGTNEAAIKVIMEKVHLPSLEELVVSSSGEITEVWHTEPQVGSFNKLKRLQVEDCGGLVKIIPFFMLKRLHNLEELVVKNCDNLEIVCELKWLIDGESSKCITFQMLASIHVEMCKCLRYLFSIPENHLQHGETFDLDKIVQLSQLTYLRLVDLPKFCHLLFQQAGQYTLKLSSLKEFLLIEAGDKEAVTHKVTFPEKLEIQVNDKSSNKFFGSTTGVLTDIVKALQQTTQVIIGLLGDMSYEYTLPALEATNMFDKVVYCWGTSPFDIQEELGRALDTVYGEVKGRSERFRKSLLSYIRNKRLLLILSRVEDEGILEASGIPPLDHEGVDPKHFKIILVSADKELLLKMGAKLPNIIPIGSKVGGRWRIFEIERRDISQGEELPLFDTNNMEICSFVGPDTLFLNNIIKALLSCHNEIIGMLGSRSDLHVLVREANHLLNDLFGELVVPDDNEVDTIQKMLETSLGIITSSSSENKAQCIRQTLLSSSSNKDKKRLILVLGDLDQEVDLQAVGIPRLDELDPKFFKIFLSSESKQVLQKMGAQQVFQRGSKPLYLPRFWRIVDGYLEKSEFVKIADECGSDDLANILANRLKDQGAHAWANAFRRLKESPFQYEERKKVIASL